MEVQLTNNTEAVSIKNNKLIFALLMLLTIPVVFLFRLAGHNLLNLTLISLMPLIFLLIMNMELTYSLFIGSIFNYIYISYASLGELFSLIVIITFLVTHKFRYSELKQPLHKPFLIFIISIIPSYINSIMLVTPVILSLRLIIFVCIFTLTAIAINKYEQIEKYLKIFLVLSVLNAFHIIFLALTTGQRVFGFAGLMYVDFVGIALVISFMKLLYTKKRLLYSLITAVLLVALIFTQTRNSWISSGLVLGMMTIQFIKRSPEMGFRRKNVIFSVAIAAIVLAGLFIGISRISESAFSRISSSAPKSSEELANSLQANNFSQINSMATRFFIWKTAWNAFTAHPVIGIGFYAFPFASEKYSTIDPFLYETFVHARAPHLTILALLTETGIIGFTGFMIFMISVYKYVHFLLKKSQTYLETYYSNTIFWFVMYIIISMLMTDAWLWGQLLMLWGVILGFALSNGKIIENNRQILMQAIRKSTAEKDA